MELVLVISVLICVVVALFLVNALTKRLFGGAGIVYSLSQIGCGSLFLGIILLIAIAAIGGFVVGRFIQ